MNVFMMLLLLERALRFYATVLPRCYSSSVRCSPRRTKLGEPFSPEHSRGIFCAQWVVLSFCGCPHIGDGGKIMQNVNCKLTRDNHKTTQDDCPPELHKTKMARLQ